MSREVCVCKQCGAEHFKPKTIKCAVCGVVVPSGRGGKKYCSATCRHSDWNAKAKSFNTTYQRIHRQQQS